MEFCPVCKSELSDGADECAVCGSRIEENQFDSWITLGYIEDKISADYAVETVRSNDIPIVIFSRSGFFGSVGLPLNPFYKSTSALFEVMVPGEYKDEVADILDMLLGRRWKRED